MLFQSLIALFISKEYKSLWIFLAMVMWLMLFLSTATFGQSKFYRLPEGITEADYKPHTIIVKLHTINEEAKSILPDIVQLVKIVNGQKYEPAIIENTSKYKSRPLSAPKVDLSRIYKISLHQEQDMIAEINKLLAFGHVAYAEPYFLPKPLFIPNDPEAGQAGNQNYLSVIKAYDAWEFEKGDSTVVIGILDTGVELAHEDLFENIAYNEADPINGVDDDGDGYVDNYQGWDFANQDNDPSADFSGHGTSVSGISSARTNNATGIAGTGFNAKFLPIKIFDSESNTFDNGYEAILYAAEQGCKVVNLSWGSVNSFSGFAQDIINRAVVDLDVVVVAAAGNTNGNLNFYPASYENVLSVGASNINDQKAGFATFSYFIDIMAPGNSEYTTKNGGGYGTATGSSFSSPMVAGIAALVRSRYPELNARQIMEKIRMTSDDIYAVSGNESYPEQLGRGRLNAQKALAPNNQPAVRMTNLSYNNKVGPYAIGGDTISLTMDFVNFLNTTSNTVVNLSTSSVYVNIIQEEFGLGSLGTMDSVDNNLNPFKIYLDPNTPANSKIAFRLGYTGINYEDYQYFEIEVNPDYVDIDNGKILFTIGSDGNLAYTNKDLTTGSGFNFNGQKILDHIGVGFGTQPNLVVDNIITNLTTGQKNADFSTLIPIKFYNNELAPVDVRSTFDDSNSAQPINLKVRQTILTSDIDSASNYLIIEYRITNTGTGDLAEFYTGIYADWDIQQYTTNRAIWDNVNNLGYIYDTNAQNQYAGIALITSQTPVFNAIDLGSENGNTADFASTLASADKYALLSNSNKTEAGLIGSGNDVAQFLSGKTLQLKQNQSIKIAFVVAVDESIALLQQTVQEASAFYTSHLQNPVVTKIVNICDGANATINPADGINYKFYTDADTTTFLGVFEEYITGPIITNQSLYVVNTDQIDDGDIEQIKIIIKDPASNFVANPDTIYLDENNASNVQFLDLSQESISWNWDFKNGYTSNVQNPSVNFNTPGTYNVEMNIVTATGCAGFASKQITVLPRGPKPNIGNVATCPNSPIILQADNANNLALYLDKDLTTLYQQGTGFSLGNIITDTIFYITNLDSLYESLPTTVIVDIDNINADFTYYTDTINLLTPALLTFNASDVNTTSWQWYLNQVPGSTSQSFNYLPTEQVDLVVSLVTQNQMGCIDSVSRTIAINQSIRPKDIESRFCSGALVAVQPTIESIYNFYEDQELKVLLHRGSTFELGKLANSKVIYYTSLASFLEGEAGKITVNIIADYAHFELPGETVFIPSGNEIKLTDLSPDGIERRWYIDGSLISIDSTFSQLFDQSGNYEISLSTENDIGCVDSLSQTLKVLIVTGISNAKIKGDHFMIYPNPTKDKVFITLPDNVSMDYTLKVYNQKGQMILIDQYSLLGIKEGISLKKLQPGIFYIQFSTSKQDYPIQKLIIE